MTRETNPADGRGALIHLTHHGYDTITPALPNISEFESELLSALPAVSGDQLADLLRVDPLHIEAPTTGG